MSIPSVALNEDSPAGSAFVRGGDDRIREFKTQVREILTIDHFFPSSGQSDACGRHKRITLIEATDIGAIPGTWVGTESTAILGAQTVSGKPELCFTNEDDWDVIITDGQKIALQNSRLPNNTYLIGRNAAGAANVNMFKVNASDIIEFATFPITPSAAPDADYEVANKKYIDDMKSTTAVADKIPVMGTSGYMPDASVDTTALKTATGEVSGTSWTSYTLPGGTYGFYPQVKCSGGNGAAMTIGGDMYGFQVANKVTATTYYTAIFMRMEDGVTGYAQQRYVTASGTDHWIFLLIDKTTKDIIGAYQAPDHPAYGNGGDFDKVSHPFGNYDETKHEIILVDQETIAELKAQVTEEKSLLTLVNEEYKPNMTREIGYQPIHSGRFIDKKPELVQSIPTYIKVRGLSRLTQVDKDVRDEKRKQVAEKVEQDKQRRQQARTSAETKLKALGLTEEELVTLRV